MKDAVKKMRAAIGAAFVLPLFFHVAGSSALAQANSANEQSPVSFNFRLPVSAGRFDTAAFFVAAARFWPKLGMLGTVLPGKGSALSVQSTGTGTDQIAIVDFAAAVIGIRQGIPITIIAAPVARDTSGVIFSEKSGVRDWADLKGKRVGFLPGAVSGLGTRAALRERGIDPESVSWQAIPPVSQLALIQAGALQIATGYVGGQDLELRCKGIPGGGLRVWDAGIQSIGQVIVVNNDWAKKMGDAVVSKALLGAIQGYTFIKAHPKESLDDVVKLRPNTPIDLETTLATFDQKLGYMPWMTQSMDERQGFAWIDSDHVSKSIATLEKAGVFEKSDQEPNISKYFTTKLLEDPDVRTAAQDFEKQSWAPVPENVRRVCRLD